MKKKPFPSQRSIRRRAERSARIKLRKPSAVPVPLNELTDTCRFFLAAESFSEKPVPGAADPLEALNEQFVQSAAWTRVTKREPTGGINFAMGMRRPEREYVAGSGLRFLAIDPDNYRGTAVSDPAAFQDFWDHQTNGRPFSMPFLKSGLAIWKKLGIKVSPETTAYIMQMDSVDAETSEAIQAAVWSAYNTAVEPIDIETAFFVLATFIHGDPLRKHQVSDEPFAEPYGDKTRYVLKPVFDPAAAKANEGNKNER